LFITRKEVVLEVNVEETKYVYGHVLSTELSTKLQHKDSYVISRLKMWQNSNISLLTCSV
jgi:hypothetical protein